MYVASDGNELTVAFEKWNNSLVSDPGKRVDATEAVLQYWPESNFWMDGNRAAAQALITYIWNSCVKLKVIVNRCIGHRQIMMTT
jgi:hypothetical protein